MDWAQEVEASDITQPHGGEQQCVVETQAKVQSNEGNKGTVTSPGGRQRSQINTSPVTNAAKSNVPQGKQQSQMEKSGSNSQTSNPDQEWQEIRHMNKFNSNTAGLTQIMGEIFTQENSKNATKRKNKTRVKSGKTHRTEIEFNKYSPESSIDAIDKSSSEETKITESVEN